jgi:hypothetical protein
MRTGRGARSTLSLTEVLKANFAESERIRARRFIRRNTKSCMSFGVKETGLNKYVVAVQAEKRFVQFMIKNGIKPIKRYLGVHRGDWEKAEEVNAETWEDEGRPWEKPTYSYTLNDFVLALWNDKRVVSYVKSLVEGEKKELRVAVFFEKVNSTYKLRQGTERDLLKELSPRVIREFGLYPRLKTSLNGF